MAQIARHPRAHCKLSGMIEEADWKKWKIEDLKPYVAKVIEMFSYDRLMFGSNWPVCRLVVEYQQVWETINDILSDISPNQRQKVFGENAKQFYGLKISS